MKYKKDSVVFEAIQFADDADIIRALSDLGLGPIRISYEDPAAPVLKLDAPQGLGVLTTKVGDYVVKLGDGVFCPCVQDFFERTYEPVEGQ